MAVSDADMQVRTSFNSLSEQIRDVFEYPAGAYVISVQLSNDFLREISQLLNMLLSFAR